MSNWLLQYGHSKSENNVSWRDYDPNDIKSIQWAGFETRLKEDYDSGIPVMA